MLTDGALPTQNPALPVTERLAAPQRSSRLTRRLLAPNPGPMTLDGTNSYLLAQPGQAHVVVVDPGPLDERHLTTLAQAGRVALIIITHQHADHTAGSARLAELTGAPVRAFDPVFCIGAPPLRNGEEIDAAGVHLRIVATPGHTADSICVHLPADGPTGSVLTGDTILGAGSTVIGHPDGTLRDYLHSLATLQAIGPATVLPAHGPAGDDLAAVCARYLQHRHDRLRQVREALQLLGPQATVEQVTDRVYSQTDARVRFAAEASVRTQLAYLTGNDDL
ncbi:MAG: MBL fold metallo-hydrolase [Cryobacterium sp.]